MTYKSDKTYLIFMITLRMNKHRRVNLKNDLYIFGLNLSVLYIAVSVRGISRWWVGRVANCPSIYCRTKVRDAGTDQTRPDLGLASIFQTNKEEAT